MNSLVEAYRSRVPGDPRSDDELTSLIGQGVDLQDAAQKYPDFVQEYNRLQNPSPPAESVLGTSEPTIGGEAAKGLRAGASSLKTSAIGLGALGSDLVGATGTRDKLIQAFRDAENESAQENTPAVGRVQDIHGFGDAAKFAAYQAGQLVPNAAEALGFGAAGAVAGSMVEPGAGTLAGGAGGLLEGFLARQTAKSLLKTLVEKGAAKVGLDDATAELAKSQLSRLARGEVVDNLAPALLDGEGKGLLASQAKAVARNYGAKASEVLNFFGLGAGAAFPQAQATNPDNADVAALIAGIGGSAGAILPGSVISKLLPGIGEEAGATYLKRLAANAAEHIPAGVVGMAGMELGNIAAERYSRGTGLDAPLSDEELSRLMNAAVVGGMAGAVTSPLTAIPGSKQKFSPAVEAHFPNVPDARRDQLAEMKGRQEAGTATATDTATARTLTPEEHAFLTVAKPVTPAETPTPNNQAPENPQAPITNPPVEPAVGDTAATSAVATLPVAVAPAAPETGMAPTREQIGQNAWDSATDNGRERLLGSRDGIGSKWQDLSLEQQKTVLTNFGYKDPVIATELARKRAAAQTSTAAPDPAADKARAQLAAARAQTNPAPTIAQKLSGNYAKGKLDGAEVGLPGLTISIETPKGTERTGTHNGQPFKVEMPGDYGYFLGTKGKDKDHVDVTIGPNPKAETVYVVDQIDPKSGDFDESKVMLGFESRTQAETAYDASFSDGSGPIRRGMLTALSKKELKDWLRSSVTTEPVARIKLKLGSGESTALERAVKGNAVDIKKFSNSNEGKAVIAKLDSFVQRPGEPSKPVNLDMLPLGDHLKIVDGIIKSIPVNVVNDLLRLEPSSKVSLHHEAMLKALPSDAVNLDANKAVKGVVPGKSSDVSAGTGSTHEPKIAERASNVNSELQITKEKGKTNDTIPKVETKVGAEKVGNESGGAGGDHRAEEVRSEKVPGDGGGGKEVANEHDANSQSGGAQPERLPESRPISIKPEDVDVERRGTYAESGRGRRGKAAKEVEPAWFRPKGDESLLKIQERLLSDSSPPSGSHRNSETGRVTALLDRETGKVHVVSTFENNGEARVTKFGERPEMLGGKKDSTRTKSWPLTDVLRAKTKEGFDRFSVLGSARTKELGEYVHDEYPDAPTFEKEFAKPVEEAQGAVRRGAAAVEKANVQAKGEPVDESTTTPGEGEGKEPEPLNLKDDEVKHLTRALPEGVTVSDMADMVMRDEKLKNLFKKIAAADPMFFSRVEEIGLSKTLKEYGYETDKGTGGKVEQRTAGNAGDNLPDAARGGTEGTGPAQTAVENKQDLPGPAKQAVQPQGPEGAGSGGEKSDNAAAVKNRIPDEAQEPTEKASSENQGDHGKHNDLLRSIHEAGTRAGIGVKVIEGDKALGAYDPNNRTLLQVVGSAIGAQDVRTALHEVGHDVFANETPEMRQRLVRAIDSLSDEALGVDTSADSRIRAADPARLGKEAVNEERLVEATATRLQEEGFDPEKAKGFAQAFVRKLKDYYLRAAMAVQRWLGFKENPELARRYFENQLRSLLAGDTRGQSYVDFVGARKLTRAEQWHRHQSNGRMMGERLSYDGRREYDPAPELDIAGLKFNLPEPTPDPSFSLKTDLEMAVSRINHKAETVGRAAAEAVKDPAVEQLAKQLKLSPDEFARRILRLHDPEKQRQWLDKKREKDGSAVHYDREKRLEDFKDKANLGQNIRTAYGTTERLWNMAGEGIAERTNKIPLLQDRLEAMGKKLTEAQDRLDAVKELKKDSSVEVRGIDKKIGGLEFARNGFRARVQALTRRIGRTQVEIEALKRMVPVLEEEKTRLGVKQRIGVESVWGNGMPYNVVDNPRATSAEIIARDEAGKVMSARTLKLDSSGMMTDPKEVQEAIDKASAFLDHRERSAEAGNENALDDVYFGIRHQRDEMMANRDYTLRVGVAERTMYGLTLSPVGDEMADGMGTPAARAFRVAMNRRDSIEESLHGAIERFGRPSLQLENDLIRLAPGFTHEGLRRDVIFPAIKTIESARDLAERYASDPAKRDRAIYARIRENLQKNPAVWSRVGPVIERFMPALEKKIEHHYAASQFLHQAVREGAGIRTELGLGVKDKTIKAINPATGERETAVRAPVEVGPRTFSKKFSRMAVAMSEALRSSGWDGFEQIIEGYAGKDEAGREAVRQDLLKLTNNDEFGAQVREDFVGELAKMEEESLFRAPADEADQEYGLGLDRPVDPDLMKQAYEDSGFEKSGDLIALAEAMHAAHGGAEAGRDAYTQQVLEKLHSIYGKVVEKLSEAVPDPNPEKAAIRGMVAPALIDARAISNLPGSWLDYHTYDQRDMMRQVKSIAAELAYGRGCEGLAGHVQTMANEAASARARYEAGIRELDKTKPGASEKEIKKFLQERFGKEGYRTLRRQMQMEPRITKAIRALSDFHRKDNSPDGTLNFMARAAHSLGMFLVQQPASAIRNMEQMFATFMKYGVSKETLAATSHGLKSFGTEAINSLCQAIGTTFQLESEDHRMYVDLGHRDNGVFQKWHDAFDPIQGEGRTTRFFRGVNDLMGIGVNRLGDKGTHIVARPLSPFTWTALLQDEALTHVAWDMARRFVRRGMDFYKDNPEALAAKDFKLTPETLGLKGASGDTFRRFYASMEKSDLNFDEMVRAARKRTDGTLLTEQEMQRLYGLSTREMSSESNSSTMPLGAYNNSVIKVLSPLLGWPFRRMMDVLSAGRTPEGKHDIATFGRGMAGISVLALGGLGVSALVSQYQQNLMGKKANLRPVLDAPNPKEFALGVMENLSRAGTFGLLGEIGNGMVNVGLGGDNRTIISLDQRVVALSAMSGIQQAVSSWVNQGQADYAHVVRPLAASMGVGGLLQYMDVANHVLGFDNFESRGVARINAQNWLRVVGRQLGLEVRQGAGGPGGYSPTPMSPALTKMEMAAYANDMADFHEAYVEAVAKAKEQGFDDPVAHVKAAFSARNPLRAVFATSPTRADYQRILSTLPGSGAQDVSEAVNLFNTFAEQIGARPFDGKIEKQKTESRNFTALPSFSQGQARSKAVAAMFR